MADPVSKAPVSKAPISNGAISNGPVPKSSVQESSVPESSVPESSVPEDVELTSRPREPQWDPTVGVPRLPGARAETHGDPPHRLVTIGDSLSHGFQSGSVFHTDLSAPAIIAYELGWLQRFRYPTYEGMGGLPLNIELLLRDLEAQIGNALDWWEVPLALYRAREFMSKVEDYWERGPGAVVEQVKEIKHNLSVYNWDLRDALSRTGEMCARSVGQPQDDLLHQLVEDHIMRAALRVYPTAEPRSTLSLFEAAAQLGSQTGDAESGIETLVVFLGANNALGSVVELDVVWSGPGYDDLGGKARYTVWRPEHFEAELAHVAAEVRKINARHVIWCTVPHVTIAPIARGVGDKITPGSRYFPYYTRPWISDDEFNPARDPHITADEARAVDSAIDQYNEAITGVVKRARSDQDNPRDWYLLDVAGVLDRLAQRRYIEDRQARPPWWQPYPLPPALAALDPPPDTRFLTADGHGGRATGGLFSLDGLHPTTVGYGILANELIGVMRAAGVHFPGTGNDQGAGGHGSPTVDFHRLIRRDTLIKTPPQSIDSSLAVLAWADETLDWVRRALPF